MIFNNKTYKFILLIFIFALLLPMFNVKADTGIVYLQNEDFVNNLISEMTPEEKVGQLLLVTFSGTNIEKSSALYDLIANHHIGGIVFTRSNNNFVDEDTIYNAYDLISKVQTIEWETSDKNQIDNNQGNSAYIPLFIGISQEGDLYPYDEILKGMTPLPSSMAIGATWNPDYANTIGTILGDELIKIGFNLLLGPSLDVYAGLNVEGEQDQGTATFSGDPYWVGEMGKSYIEGVHQGSENKVLVVSKHFPGSGGSDRTPDLEVPTVRKSLEQLKQIELAPFFSVTGRAPSDSMTTDGILVSHIRYQGFQGNIRATTKPVSFDSAALEQLMSIDEFSGWRQNGGVMISDNLGSEAVRRFYDPTGQSFDARQVARNAFLAGNDVLYLDNFVSTGDPDEYTTIIRTLEFFTQKYEEDQVFSQRVDASVRRILNKKFSVYPEFLYSDVIQDVRDLDDVGQSGDEIFQIAQFSSTLISPDKEDLNTDISDPPGLSDRILFITDVMISKQCDGCVSVPALQANSLEKSVIKLYGPEAAGQILQYNISSYSFSDLTKVLDGTAEDLPLSEELLDADWIVIGMLNPNKDRPESYALKRLLTEKPEIIRNKTVIVFAFNAPYYLDATDISKITAYYGLYSKIPVYIDVAARLLFQEISPLGSLPVNVPGVGYDLINATSPDSGQTIPLFIDRLNMDGRQPRPAIGLSTLEPENMSLLQIGDTLQFRTGVIYDQNQNPVPDGTVARFIINTGGEIGTSQQIETTTIDGIAESTYLIQNSGIYDISVISEPATLSDVIQINIEADEVLGNGIIQEVVITQTVEPTQVSPTQPIPEEDEINNANLFKADGADWLFSMVIIWGSAVGIYWYGKRKIAIRWSIRWALITVLTGAVTYLFLAIILPGRGIYFDVRNYWMLFVILLISIIVAQIINFIWWKKSQ